MSEQTYDVNLDRNELQQLNFGEPCVRFTRGEFCKECKSAADLYRQRLNHERGSKEYVNIDNALQKLSANTKVFVNAISVKSGSEDPVPKIYVLTAKTFKKVIAAAKGLAQIHPGLNIFHPQKGCKVIITKSGVMKSTDYSVNIDPTPSPLPDNAISTQMHNLDNIEQTIKHTPAICALLENGINVLRLLPPYDEKGLIRAEMKFHYYKVEDVLGNGGTPKPRDQEEHGDYDEYTNGHAEKFNTEPANVVKSTTAPVVDEVESFFGAQHDTSDNSAISNQAAQVSQLLSGATVAASANAPSGDGGGGGAYVAAGGDDDLRKQIAELNARLQQKGGAQKPDDDVPF